MPDDVTNPPPPVTQRIQKQLSLHAAALGRIEQALILEPDPDRPDPIQELLDRQRRIETLLGDLIDILEELPGT